MNRALYALGLTAIWIMAWGSLSVANVLSGLAVAAFLWVLAPDTWPPSQRVPLRPVAVARLLGLILVMVVQSNVMITREVLSRRPRVDSGVIAVTLPDCSDGLLTLVANVMAIPPGTMAVEVSRQPTVVYVHVFHLTDPEATRRHVQHLTDLAYRAFASDAKVEALDADWVALDGDGPAGPAPSTKGDDR